MDKFIASLIFETMNVVETLAKRGPEWRGAGNSQEWAKDYGPLAFIYNTMSPDVYDAQIQILDKPVLHAGWYPHCHCLISLGKWTKEINLCPAE